MTGLNPGPSGTAHLIGYVLGFLVILLIVCVAFYMFFSQYTCKKKSQTSCASMDSGDVVDTCHVVVVKPPGRESSEKSVKSLKSPPLPMPVVENSVRNSEKSIKSEPAKKSIDSEKAKTATPMVEKSEKIEETPVKPVESSEKTVKIGSAETSSKVAPGDNGEKVVSMSAEKVGQDSGSDMSILQISSQRSEMNNFNMLEAGRTPPTDSRIESLSLSRTPSTETLVKSSSAAPSSNSVATPVQPVELEPKAAGSETSVSVTTPPQPK